MSSSTEALGDTVRRIAMTTLRRRWLALGVTAIVAVIGATVVRQVPDRYEATARVYVDTQKVLKPLMSGLTFQPDIDQQVAMLARTLISHDSVDKLISRPELHLDDLGGGDHDAAVVALMSRIKVAPTASGNLFEITYRGPNAVDAQRLVQAIVTLFMNSGIGAKRRDSAEAGRFIEDQIKSYEAKLIESESRVKEFKVRNFGVSGLSNQDYFLRISTLGEAVSRLRVELGTAEQARNAYRRELGSEDPQLPPDQLGRFGGGPAGEAETRVAEQRRRLDDLLRRYTEAHPDVVSARRSLAELEAASKLVREGTARSGGKAATSPVYQKLRVSLAENEVLVASVRSQLGAQQARLDEVRALASQLPQVEAELAQLNRDYEVMRKNYEVLVARRESASLGERLDESSQLAEFRLVEAASVAPKPVFPARLHLALLVVAVSLVAGVASTLVIDLVRPTFDDDEALQRFSTRPMLGTVSMLRGDAASRLVARRAWSAYAAAAASLFLVQAAWIAWAAQQPLPR